MLTNAAIMRIEAAAGDLEHRTPARIAEGIARAQYVLDLAASPKHGEAMLAHTKRTLEKEINERRPGHVNRREAWSLYAQARRHWDHSLSPFSGRTPHTLKAQALFYCILAINLARE